MADWGRLFAVCCVDGSSTMIVDKFLSAAYSTRHSIPLLVVIDNLETKYVEPTLPPVEPFSTPFNGKDSRECCQIIREMTQQAKSDLNYQYIVILDKRSSEDSTALLVASRNEEDEILSVRVAFDSTDVLLSISAGCGSMEESREIAEKAPDKVIRTPKSPEQPKTSTKGKLAPRKQLKKRS